MDFAIFNAALLNSKKPEIRLPWEEGFGQYIFGRETPETLDARRLLAARLYKSDDHLQSLALKRMRSIVLFHPRTLKL